MSVHDEIAREREQAKRPVVLALREGHGPNEWICELLNVLSVACFNARGLRRTMVAVAATAIDCIEALDQSATQEDTNTTKETT